ncbi:vWA domain-containing protein [Gordonia sp. NPDC003425]
MLTLSLLSLTFVACSTDGTATKSAGSSPNQESPKPTMIVLDASDSMNTDDAPGPRIDAAKSAVTSLVDSLPGQSEIGVVVFGGTVPSERGPQAGCADVETVSQLAPIDAHDPRPKIAGVTAQGWSPVGKALLAASEPLSEAPGSIVLVSDGESNCQPDPCETAQKIRTENPDITISAVGFKTDAAQLKCIAAAGGGVFVTADNTAQLTARLSAVQTADTAASQLSAEGLYGIEIGQSIGDVRAAHADFPSGSGTTVVEWRDCKWHFDDGVLTRIEPKDPSTIDGVRAGTPMTRLVELYGAPIQVDETIKRAYFTANRDKGTAFVVDYDGDTTNGTVKTIYLCKCLPAANASESAPAGTSTVSSALTSLCGVIAETRVLQHPKLGTVSVGISRPAGQGAGEGCVAAVGAKGQKLLVQKVSVYGDEIDFADPPTDSTKNVFITYNPGRYNGVITLVPDDKGYEDIGWGDDDPGYQTTKNAYYSAELKGPGSDGKYTIETSANDCDPSCADGTITKKTLKWNGSSYK